MGREIKRVPLDFDWPIDEIWSGFLMPDSLREEKCTTCAGDGYSAHARRLHDRWYGNAPFEPAETGSTPLTPETPAVWAFAKRNVEQSRAFYADYLGGTGDETIRREAVRLCGLWNSQWAHHLSQEDVDVLIEADRLWDFTRTLTDTGWVTIEPRPVVTAAQVNTWSLIGFGHDAINCWKVVRAACKRDGEAVECSDCAGHGCHEKYVGQRAEAEAWERTEPPEGDGWQLWETVSEGSPISPVFATGDQLAAWMVANPRRLGPGNERISMDTAKKWVHGPGWAVSGVMKGGKAVSSIESAVS